MKTLILSFLALASSTSAHAMVDTNCVDSDGRILAIQPVNGKQGLALVANGKEIDLLNVSDPLSGDSGQAYLASNKEGYAAHVIYVPGVVFGTKWDGKASGTMLTPDGRLIVLDDFFCKKN